MPADSSGVHTTPPIFNLRAQSTRMGSEAMIVMIQPTTFANVNPITGQLQSADALETVVREYGGQPLELPQDFSGPAAPSWSATLVRDPNHLLITCAGREIYDGTMPVARPWVDVVTARARKRHRGVVHSEIVMVTGPIPDLASIDAVLLAGRASWVRIALTLS